MKFEELRDFMWYNEPENVVFGNDEFKVVARERTDFWQSEHHNFSKDDGHFFYIEKAEDFCCVVHWRFDKKEHYNQCGLMVRVDKQNWFKVSVMSAVNDNPELASSLTLAGNSDWAGIGLPRDCSSLWYKLIRRENDYVAFYSFDGKNFIRLRQFYMPSAHPQVMVGAYICAPQNNKFQAVLKEINFADK